MKKGSERHKWGVFWSDELNEAIEKCSNCGLEKRKVYIYKAGGHMKGSTIAQIKVDGKWINNFPHPCNKITDK